MKELLIQILRKHKNTILLSIAMLLLSFIQLHFLLVAPSSKYATMGVSYTFSLMFLAYTMKYGYEIQMLKDNIGTSESIRFNIKMLNGMPIPEYATDGAAGFDLMANITDPITLYPGERQVVPTGLSTELPVGYEIQVRPRSGNAIKLGLSVLNAPGTIDCDFRGEIGVILINHSNEPVVIARGDKVAQGILAKVVNAQMTVTNELTNTSRGPAGYGSTDT